MSTRVLAQLYSITEGKIPLIGVGGVFTVNQLFQKIQAGASLVQIYSALIYSGFSVTNKILRELDFYLRENGFKMWKRPSELAQRNGYENDLA